MQLSRTCKVADHQQKVIEHICIYPQCKWSRLFCSKFILGPNHKHNKNDSSHIVDNGDFQEIIRNKLSHAKSKQQQMECDFQNQIVPLKQLTQEIQNLQKNVEKIIQQVEQGQLKNLNISHLENQLLNVQKYGFNQIDDQQLNDLINMPEQQQELDIYKQLEEQSNLIIQNSLKIKEWRLSQVVINQRSSSEKIKDAKYQIQSIDKCNQDICTGAISNDLKYTVSGGDDQLLKIWDYRTNEITKSIQLNNGVSSLKFTEDSTLLYAGSSKWIYQFDVNNQFQELYKQEIQTNWIYNIYCISNTIILTTSVDKCIIKTDVHKQQQLLKIQEHDNWIQGLDCNKSGNMIASGSSDKSIKLWNGTDGSLILQKLQNCEVSQVLFIIHDNKLISLNDNSNLKIWNINFQAKQLEQLQLMENSAKNISLVLYIISTGSKFIKVHSIKGEFVRQFDHEVYSFWCKLNILYFYIIDLFPTIQLDSMKAVLIIGYNELKVCKLQMD